jgi:glycosyltransferase involved in cell wall biosynthesis
VRIAIDASGAAREDGTGVAVYIGELSRTLAKIAPNDEFVLYYRASRVRARKLFLDEPGPNFETAFPPLSFLKTRGVDLAHGPDSRLLNIGRTRTVTVHDVFSLISDEWADEKFRRKKAARYAQIAKKAHLIICDSKSTADDFARLFPGSAGRLRVVPLGVNPRFKPQPPQECEKVLERLGIRRPFILHVGNIANRKNLFRLVLAFELLASSRPELHLVLAGRLSYRHEEVLEKISLSGAGDRIHIPGYVSMEDLPYLYSGAAAFVFPSLYEGFGLPALEAMACGIPVVASDRSSLPEVVGDTGILVNPEKEDEIAQAIDKLLSDTELHGKLSEAGINRAKEFTWERTARETLAVYREAAS